MNDVMNVDYQYIPLSNEYTASISMQWVMRETYEVYLAAWRANSIVTIVPTWSKEQVSGGYTWGEEAVAGYVVGVNMTPAIPELGTKSPWWNGTVQISSYNKYSYRVMNKTYSAIANTPFKNISVSVAWMPKATAAAYEDMTGGTQIDNGPGGVSGYFVNSSFSPSVPDLGDACNYVNGTIQLTTRNPFAMRMTSFNMGGPYGSIQRNILGGVIIYAPTNGVQAAGRSVSVSYSWVDSGTAFELLDAANLGSVTPPGCTVTICTIGGGANAQIASQDSYGYGDAGAYYNVSINGIVSG